MERVRLDLGGIHRRQVMRRDHPLAKLLEAQMGLQGVAELGLAEQQDLQQRMRAELEVGEHAQLFERFHCKVLRLVHHQQAATARPGLLMQEALDRAERGSLIVPLYRKPEALRDDMDNLLAAQLARYHLADGQLPGIDRCDHVRHEGGLARADFTGDDDEAFALRKTITQIRQCLAVRSAGEIEGRVRRQLERLAAQSVKFLEHSSFPQAQNV